MLKILKKVVFSFFLLYGFNIIATKFNIIIPIYYLTVALVFLLDIPGMVMLTFISLLIL